LQVLDRTVTPMGARLLKKWLVLPVKEIPVINDRLAIVEYAYHHAEVRDKVMDHLKSIGDLERLISKVAMGE
jgi:DNA mismatch repair protein MutS